MGKFSKRELLCVLPAILVGPMIFLARRFGIPDFATGFAVGCLIVLTVFGITQGMRRMI